ncbi:DUF1272 domain-containing protein [Leptospira fluminis]|uniref:DUF1272 domain-containing protein n=1 Tax=Leptospira fluminis TaxID=2484979 RepID=A0A4R9GMZ5_9LEPT|nr:DUF1272 domain-containing protein [Leptospira fluminis]TGK15353.1 DUF1272 domain-containing protein [Leptospira fluminis]
MLELRPVCENCAKPLPNESLDAFICSFECTFCQDCVTSVLQNVCPNCGGGFERRPIRPIEKLRRFPAVIERRTKPVDLEKFHPLLLSNRDVPPQSR